MSYPNRETRKLCWENRDSYWACLDKNNVKDSSEIPKECEQLRKLFEQSCPAQWVTYFDRRKNFLVFKEKMEKGYDPLQEAK